MSNILRVSYLSLLKENPKYRTFWSASVISMFGEWFNTIALFVLILEFSDSEFLLGLLFTIRMIAFAIFQPFIGIFADRYSRKTLMLISNLIQIPMACGFMLVESADDLWWMIGLSGLMMISHSLFMTSERAALPNIVSEGELATANALDAASWSTALCFGALIGGLIVDYYGVNLAFILNALTFVIAFLILLRIDIPQDFNTEKTSSNIFKQVYVDMKTGISRITSDRKLLRIVFAKASWNVAGGGLAGVFLVLMGADIDGFGVSIGFGIFFFARGIGTGLGPIIARRVFTNSNHWPLLTGLLVVVSGIFYFLVGLTLNTSLGLTMVLVIIAHAASGANWVLSTILTQQWVEDKVRGRVFSVDMLLLSIAFSISSSIAGGLVELEYVNLQNGIMSFACVMVISGILISSWNPKDNKNRLVDTPVS